MHLALLLSESSPDDSSASLYSLRAQGLGLELRRTKMSKRFYFSRRAASGGGKDLSSVHLFSLLRQFILNKEPIHNL